MFGTRHRVGNLIALSFVLLGVACMGLPGCGSGSTGAPGAPGMDGADGADGAQGPPGPSGPPATSVIDVGQTPDEILGKVEVVSQITRVTISSPPVVTFTLKSANGTPITGIVPFWTESKRFVRFTLCKLVAGTNGDPDSWVSYVRDEDEPDYDTGASLVDNGDGSYVFTFLTDVTNVAGVPYEPTLTHRLGGQIGSGAVALAPQNFVHDFVPAGGALPLRRDIATMESCNECHTDLVFHGRRFEVEYCTTCHNPDLADGEGNLSFMIHRIHAAGKFDVLDDAKDYSHVTYPQSLANCRKCHTSDDVATPQGDNWRERINREACSGCHTVFEDGTHPLVPDPTNAVCSSCHTAAQIEVAHLTPNSTPNNPFLFPGSDGGVDQRLISYELIDAGVDNTTGAVTVNFRILSGSTALDMTRLPADLLAGGNWPSFLLAWALTQDGLSEPMDYNNLGRRAAQPLSLSIGRFSPMETTAPIGTLSFAAATGINTAVITDGGSQYPMGATLRAVGLQGYMRQDIDNDGSYDVSLHTPSAVVAVTGDQARRKIVSNDKCANCHEWFEGHGGNRTYDIAICTLCHVPNLSSSGRTVTDPTARSLNSYLAAAIADKTLSSSVDASADPQAALTYPEDAQNLRDLVHGIHSSDFRTRHFQHVRGPSRQGYYDWDHLTFPRGSTTRNCLLCHEAGTFELPVASDLLAATVRTTGAADGQDATVAAAEAAFVAAGNLTDWINTPTAGSCFMCHTSESALGHMLQNGALLSAPDGSWISNRSALGTTVESCATCHGAGKTWDVTVVHFPD